MDESLTSSAKNFTRRVSTCLALVGNNLGPYGRAMLSHVGKPIALEYTTTTSEWSEQTIRNLHFVSNRIWSSTWQIGFSRCVASQAKRREAATCFTSKFPTCFGRSPAATSWDNS